eukprot:maker-scaffold428_size174301-snap-gene-0.23 protein:Tk03106 transcript:maker-scaffold428_size174301-snap-gene-0.23-mRNA-1 annotation:"hypothetical protein DAPPUDRAFT_328004"
MLRTIQRLVRSVTVEPVLFLYMLGVYLLFSVFQNLVYEKVCLQHANATVCANLYLPIHEDVLDQVQKDASFWIKASTLAMVGPSILVDCYMGAWSDIFGRKPPLLLPPLGALLGGLVYCMMELFASHVAWILLASGLFGIFGSFTGMLTGVLAYMSAASPVAQRTSRISIVISMNFLAGTMGPFLSGFLATRVSPLCVFVCIVVCHFLCILYTLLCVKNIFNHTSSDRSGWTWRQLFSLRHLKSSFETCFIQRSGMERRNIILLFIMAVALMVITSGELDIAFLFLKDKPMKMDLAIFSYWFGSRYGLSSLMLLVLMPILKQKWEMPDQWICLIGLISKISALILLGLSTTPLMAFLDVPLGCLGSFALASIRAMLSLNVEDHEQGKLFGLLSVVEDVSALCGALLFNSLYPITRSFFNGTMFLVSAVALLLPAALVFGIVPRHDLLELQNDHSYLALWMAGNASIRPEAAS